MRHFSGFLALIIVLFTVSARSEMIESNHQSTLLGTEKMYNIYLPEPRTDEERFPVLYVLHGKYGDYTDWVKRGGAAEAAQKYRMILVIPDGGPFSWYLDSPLMADSQYESYISEELVSYIDQNYPTLATRDARGVMGLSMGGHGALLMALDHPDVFGSASSLSGILKLTNHPYREDVIERLGPWRENMDRWEQNSVYDRAADFEDADVRILFDSGVDDNATGAIWDGRLLHEKLVKLGIPHIWREHAGTHSWDYWKSHLPEHLNFHQAAMIDQQPDEEKWFVKYFTRMDDFLRENEQLAVELPQGPTLALLGSSTFEGFPSKKIESFHVFNRGIVSDHVGIYDRGLSRRLEESIFDMKPDVALINMGVNDIGDRHRNEDGQPTEYLMAREYEKIVNQIQSRLPGTRLIICACTPTGGRYVHLNESIDSWNKWLHEFTSAKGLPIIDMHDAVSNAEGHLDEQYSNDGLHLNEEGNTIWASLINGALADSRPGHVVYTATAPARETP
jgi:S-formylglutathione hydrolase FrmB/lysophospholipase L1-like esterase